MCRTLQLSGAEGRLGLLKKVMTKTTLQRLMTMAGDPNRLDLAMDMPASDHSHDTISMPLDHIRDVMLPQDLREGISFQARRRYLVRASVYLLVFTHLTAQTYLSCDRITCDGITGM